MLSRLRQNHHSPRSLTFSALGTVALCALKHAVLYAQRAQRCVFNLLRFSAVR
jgi:hypothetical protein